MLRKGTVVVTVAACALAAGSLAIAGCGGDSGGADSAGDRLSGNIVADGSSTVAPLTSAAAEMFADENGAVNITVGTSGTGGGFQRFCAGDTEIADASREIKPDEAEVCAAANIGFKEFRVASDGITVVSGKNVGLGSDNITLDQLKAVWGNGSKISNWNQIPQGTFNDLPLTLAGPGSQSGTYDFFNEIVLGKDPKTGEIMVPRQDYSASEDDNVTVRAVAGSAAGMGYFGFSYYEENMDQLKALTLDGIEPTVETISDGSYPLARPLFIYVNNDALNRPEVNAFVRFYLENALELSQEQQFVPAPQESLDEALASVPEVK